MHPNFQRKYRIINMAWNDFTLSTTTSISRHQSNINQLAPETIPVHYYDIIGGTSSVHMSLWSTPVVVTFGSYETDKGNFLSNDTEYVFPQDCKWYGGSFALSVGQDLQKEDLILDFNTIYLGQDILIIQRPTYEGNWDLWNMTLQTEYISQGWQPKISLAKQKLAADLLIQFRSRGIVDQLSPLDKITNSQCLTVVSDYLTLALIYTQLALQGLNQIYQQKRNWYWKQYQNELHNVGAVIQLSGSRTTNYVGILQI